MALEAFLVEGVSTTGLELGRGAYGRVVEIRIPGALCAAKIIHDELLRESNAANITTKFAEECKLMSTLRHPHVVQFLGVCYLPDSSDNIPCLVMERLECDLHRLLETVVDVPITIKKSILTGVANGLVYLHSRRPSIIHRDLTARNVLLDSSMTARIGDMGVARIIDIPPGQLALTMSKGPGNVLYMAPEALEDRPRYNTSLDVFSFGNLMLFTLTQTLPNLKGATYVDPDTKALCPRSEIDRRKESINQLEDLLGDQNHPFVLLAKQCLHNVPGERPLASDIVSTLDRTTLIPYRLWDSNKLEIIRDLLSSEAQGRRVKWQTEVFGQLAVDDEREQGDLDRHHQLSQSFTEGPYESGLDQRQDVHVPQKTLQV